MSDKPKLHLVGLPHTETTEAYSWCAFTALAINMATMMTRQGYEVILYASENNDAECAELVICNDPPVNDPLVAIEWTHEYFSTMNNRVIEAMKSRLAPHDLILLSMGYPQKPIADAFPNHISVEYAVGYSGIGAKFQVYPSSAWMHILYGYRRYPDSPQSIEGNFYDAIIPHFIDADQFPACNGGDYLLFVGRLIPLKGIEIAVELSKRTGIPLKVVGAGNPPDYGEYLGVVRPKQRAKLMGNALAVVAPSLYCEPFCLVPVEANMCGTPAITTDFGAFVETIENGVNGFRCHNMAEFEQAVEDIKGLDRKVIRDRTISKYSLEVIGQQYDDYFQRLETLWTNGFYTKR